MGWIKTFKNKDGSYDSFDWSIETSITVKILTILLPLALVMVTSAIASAYCLLFYAVSIPKHRVQQGIGGMIGSGVWVLDYMFGIFTWNVLHEFTELYVTITAINLIMFILHAITLIFDKVTFAAVDYKDGWLVSIVAFGVIIYKGLPAASRFVENVLTMSETSLFL